MSDIMPEEVVKLSAAAKDALTKSRGYILGEVIKIAKNNNGKIDIESKDIQELIEVFIKTEPVYFNADGSKKDNPPVSFKATLKEQEERINALIKGNKEKGKEPIETKHFEALRKDIAEFKAKLEDDLSTQSKIEQAVKERIRDNRILGELTYGKDIDEKGNVQMMFAGDKDKVIEKIKDIQLPDEILSVALKNDDLLVPLRSDFNNQAIECFNKDGIDKHYDNICIWDPEKINDKQIVENYQKLASHDTNAFLVIQENPAFQNMDKSNNQRFTLELLPVIKNLSLEEMKEKGSQIIQYFVPLLENAKLSNSAKSALAKLDAAYLAEYGGVIATDLKKVNDKGTSLWEKVKSVFTGKNYLENREKEVINNYAIKSDEYVEKKIIDKIHTHALTNSTIAASLTTFMNENESALKNNPELKKLFPPNDGPIVVTTAKVDKNQINRPTQLDEINNAALVKIRQINPVAFDNVMQSGKQAQNTKTEHSQHIQEWGKAVRNQEKTTDSARVRG